MYFGIYDRRPYDTPRYNDLETVSLGHPQDIVHSQYLKCVTNVQSVNMKYIYCVAVILLLLSANIEGKKTGRSRSSGSSRGSSRKTNVPQPAPTSFSSPQASAPKPSLSGWQVKPKQTSQSHSYPSSNTGLSGNSKPANQPPPSYDSVQKSHSYPQNAGNHQGSQQSLSYPQNAGSHQGSQQGHSYPSSGGLSGQSNAGAGYPQGGGLSGAGRGTPQQAGGLSGSGAGYPQQAGAPAYSGPAGGYPHPAGGGHAGGAPPPYPGNTGYNGHQYAGGSYGNNNYHHPQGPPPPYPGGFGGNGGHGAYHPGFTQQSPGYFGNYNSGRGFGGMGRSSSALTGVGLAGAGVGTLLTGLALWNLARSTGNRHHTVVYDNRGAPIAVEPQNKEDTGIESILGELINCTLTIDTGNATEVLAIPCSIATSFSPEANVKNPGTANDETDKTKCTVTVINKELKEFMTTIPCSTLLNSAAENNVTEPPPPPPGAVSDPGANIGTGPNDPTQYNQPPVAPLLPVTINTENKSVNCSLEPGVTSDPMNPCFPAATPNLTVLPLLKNESLEALSTPSSA